MRWPIRINLTKPPSWRENASNVAAWDAWDRRWRHKLGWRAGLQFWGKTNTPGSRVLLSRHWPHRLCWDWSIWVGVTRPLYDGPAFFIFSICRPYRNMHFRLWRLQASMHWQDSSWMAALGPYREEVPAIYWAHHLENAKPAGSA